jgi:Fur family zinc uptake transcriptional regulator
MTRLRRLVLQTLTQAGEPVKAYDLLEILRSQGERLTPSTIYRILDFLESQSLIHRVNSLAAYLACANGQTNAHQPLLVVCAGCQKTTEVHDPELRNSIARRLETLGLSLTATSVEIRGLCPQCAPPV